MHITTASQGTLPALNADADDLMIENTTPGITLMGSAGGGGLLAFGDTNDADVGRIFYYHIDNSMKFYTAGASQMTIDSSGRVLMSNQPAISGQAGAASGQFTGTSFYGTFNPGTGSGQSGQGGMVHGNSSSGWTTTYASAQYLQVPVTGNYIFLYCNGAYDPDSTTDVRINIHINSTQVARLDHDMGDGNNGAWISVQSSTMHYMSAGDTLRMSWDARSGNPQSDGGVWGYFSFYLHST